MIALVAHSGAAALGAVLWAVLALAIPFFRPVQRGRVICLLVFCGVPLLGWLTYLHGPGFGVMLLALGLSLLLWPPLGWLRRRSRPGAKTGVS